MDVVKCKYFRAGLDIMNPFDISCRDGLGRTTQRLDHVVVFHILSMDKIKFQINEYNDCGNCATPHKLTYLGLKV